MQWGQKPQMYISARQAKQTERCRIYNRENPIGFAWPKQWARVGRIPKSTVVERSQIDLIGVIRSCWRVEVHSYDSAIRLGKAVLTSRV